MKKRSSISKATTITAIGEYWDTHDAGDILAKAQPVAMTVDIVSEKVYCAVDLNLAENAQKIARRRGISTDTLINLWIQEKVTAQHA